MRRFAFLTFVCTFLFASFAYSQQIDIAAGGSTLWSPKNNTASGGFVPPPLKGGIYPSVFLQYISDDHPHYGVLAEGSYRYYQAYYSNSYQPYRPILYDVNALYTTRLAAKTHGDFMAGVGGETLLFYSSNGCGLAAGGCHPYTNATHLLFHFGVGIRYYVWRNLFARGEAHYYFIPNNYEFHSDNVFRVGVNIGYSWGRH